jgi:hypothetical protein
MLSLIYLYYICNYSIQSARLSILSFALDTLTSTPARYWSPPPLGQGGDTLPCGGRGGGGPNSDDGTDTHSRYTLITCAIYSR